MVSPDRSAGQGDDGQPPAAGAAGRPLTIVIGGLGTDAALVLAKLARHSMVAHVECAEEAIGLLQSTLDVRAHDDATTGALTVGSLRIDPRERRVSVGGAGLAVSENEFRLLHTFSGFPRKALSYRELIVAISGSDHGMDVPALFAAIRRLRRKLESAGADVHIEAVRGFGFRLVTATDALVDAVATSG